MLFLSKVKHKNVNCSQDDFGRCFQNDKTGNGTITEEHWDDVRTSSWKFLIIALIAIGKLKLHFL